MNYKVVFGEGYSQFSVEFAGKKQDNFQEYFEKYVEQNAEGVLKELFNQYKTAYNSYEEFVSILFNLKPHCLDFASAITKKFSKEKQYRIIRYRESSFFSADDLLKIYHKALKKEP